MWRVTGAGLLALMYLSGLYWGHTLRVHKEGLLACCRVSSNNGVLCCDGVTTGNSALVQAVVDLLDAGVQSLEAMEAFLELRGETPVG